MARCTAHCVCVPVGLRDRFTVGLSSAGQGGTFAGVVGIFCNCALFARVLAQGGSHSVQDRMLPFHPPIQPKIPPDSGGGGGEHPTQCAPAPPLHTTGCPDVTESEPTGGSPTPRGSAGVPEASSGTASARRGSGTQRANPGAPAAQHHCVPVSRGSSTQWATTGAPEAFFGSVSARRGSGTQRANPGAPAAQYCLSPAPRGSSIQWATTGAPEVHCGKKW